MTNKISILFNNLYKFSLENNLYFLANFIDNTRLDDIILTARLRADFDLTTHMKSMKIDLFPIKPSCPCSFCTITYKRRLLEREYTNIKRQITKIQYERSTREHISLLPNINKERIWANPKYVNSLSVKLKTDPFFFSTKQMRLAYIYLRQSRKFRKLGRRLHRILSIPGNE